MKNNVGLHQTASQAARALTVDQLPLEWSYCLSTMAKISAQ